jgi:MFS family permease
MTTTVSTPSYRALLAVPGFPRLVSSALLSRTAAQMSSLVLVLFVLDRYHSPQLAGLAVGVSVVPGLLLSPVAGALLDRGARVPLIMLDYCIGGLALASIAVLALAGLLPPWLLVLICGASSLTIPLSNSGTRSLFPMMVPRHMWDRANAVDSGGYVVATVVGPGLAGAIVALLHPTAALLVPAALSLSAAPLLAGMQTPRAETASSRGILGDAWDGLAYVVRNRGLRTLAVTVSLCNVANGVITVALPVMVLTRLHGGSVEVGLLFAVMGVAGIVAGLVTGRFDSEGRERTLLMIGCAGTVVAVLVLAVAQSAAVAALATGIFGLSNGPLDIGLFSLRQRVTAPAWFGRAFAVSMSLNFIGYPIGSALAGPVVARSITAALLLGAVAAVAATLAPWLMLPRRR